MYEGYPSNVNSTNPNYKHHRMINRTDDGSVRAERQREVKREWKPRPLWERMGIKETGEPETAVPRAMEGVRVQEKGLTFGNMQRLENETRQPRNAYDIVRSKMRPATSTDDNQSMASLEIIGDGGMGVGEGGKRRAPSVIAEGVQGGVEPAEEFEGTNAEHVIKMTGLIEQREREEAAARVKRERDEPRKKHLEKQARYKRQRNN